MGVGGRPRRGRRGFRARSLFTIDPLERRLLLATITVTTNDDLVDGDVSNIDELIAEPGPTGVSLREAMLALAETGGRNVIAFDLAEDELVIRPTSPLPVLIAGVIDGFTQPGSAPNTLPAGNDAVIKVRIDGANAGAGADGITVRRDYGSTIVIRGLSITGFAGSGIVLTTGSTRVEGCYVGVTPDGLRGACGYGVTLHAGGNQVGSTTPAGRCVISGNTNDAIRVARGAMNLELASIVIVGNLIGTTPDGTGRLGNGRGVFLGNARSIFLGGADPDAANVISGNDGDAVVIDDGLNVVIEGNYLGTDRSGTLDLGNTGSGVRVINGSGRVRVGDGTNPGASNTIHFNRVGIEVEEDGSNVTDPHTYEGNSIFGNDTNVIDPYAPPPPVITDVSTTPAQTTVSVSYSGVPNSPYSFFFYGTEVGDNGGKVLIGRGQATTDANGFGAFTQVSRTTGWPLINAAMIGPSGLGSRRSASVVNAGNFLTVTSAGHSGPGTLRDALEQDGDKVVRFDVASATGGPVMIELLSPLIPGAGNFALDGSTQPGFRVVPRVFLEVFNNLTLDGGDSVIAMGFRAWPSTAMVAGGTGGNTVAHNFFGLNTDGKASGGLFSNQGPAVTIPADATDNQVLNNYFATSPTGVEVFSSNNDIVGNVFGTDITRTLSRPVAFPIQVRDGSGNLIQDNAFSFNQVTAIDLGFTGVNLNDPGDTDVGPNGLQNYPVITLAEKVAAGTRVRGTLNSAADSSFTVQVFVSPENGVPLDVAQAARPLGTTTVLTGPDGNGSFDVTFPAFAEFAERVTATATNNATRDTSELSANTAVSDTTRPRIVEAIGREYGLEVIFSEQPSGVDSGDVTLVNVATGQAVPRFFSVDGGGTRVAYDIPEPPLLPPGRYRATFAAGAVTDAAGNPLEPYSFEFTVRAEGTIVVDTNLDVVDPNDGKTSLREAMLTANGNGNATVDNIDFELPAGSMVIRPTSPLPPITTPTNINGFSQPGSSPNTLSEGNNAVVLVQIDGFNTSGPFDTHAGLLFESSSCRVSGVSITRFQNGIRVAVGVEEIQISACLIGLNPAGIAQGNYQGIVIHGTNVLVGGITAADRCVVSASNADGILITGDANEIMGTFVGTSLRGDAALGNARGIFVIGNMNLVGHSQHGNVIGGNSETGVALAGQRNYLQGNAVGTDFNGNARLGNGIGVSVSGFENIISGTPITTTDGAPTHWQFGNIIAFNQTGLSIGSGLTRPTMRGNLIYENNTNIFENFTPVVPRLDPVLTTTRQSTATARVDFAMPDSTYQIDLYGNTDADPEASVFLTSIPLQTDASGNGVMAFEFPPTWMPFITAMATGPSGRTSNFAATVPNSRPMVYVVETTEDLPPPPPGGAAGGAIPLSLRGALSFPGPKMITFDPALIAAGPTAINLNPILGPLPMLSNTAIDARLRGWTGLSRIYIAGQTNSLVLGGNSSVMGLGLFQYQGFAIAADFANGNTIAHNMIGIGPDGRQPGGAVGPVIGSAIHLYPQSSQNRVWFNHVANDDIGIFVARNGNTIFGNVIGTDVTRTLDRRVANPIRIEQASSNQVYGNVIGFSQQAGVAAISVIGAASQGNDLRRNLIFNSTGVGIDLGANGVTANDLRDVDSGPNRLQNFPVITSVEKVPAGTRVRGTLNSLAEWFFMLEFFASPATTPAGTRAAVRFLGETFVDTDENGNATFDVTLPAAVEFGELVTATTVETDEGDTSELSAPVSVGDTTPPTFVAGELVQRRSLFVRFSENVGASVDPSDLLIERVGGGTAPVVAHATFIEQDNIAVYVLAADPAPGTYRVTIAAGVVMDVKGNALVTPGTFEFTVTPAEVVARHVFYNNSGYDGRDPAANAADDAAIAPNKTMLRPGQVPGFPNVTTFPGGVNGVMLDVRGFPPFIPSAYPIQFDVASSPDSANWTMAPSPLSVTLRPGAGVGGSDRVSFIFADGAIKNRWLRGTIPGGPESGLGFPDVFYVGNLVGDTGNAAPGAAPRVDAGDVIEVRKAYRSTDPATVFRLDINQDRRVNIDDLAWVRRNMGRSLQFASAPPIGVAPTGSTPSRLAPRRRPVIDALFSPPASVLA